MATLGHINTAGNTQAVIDANSNDGQVKVNTGNGIRPRWDSTTASINGVWQQVTYQAPLGISSAPTTSWPANNPSPVDSDIYDFANNSFVENKIPGQVNFWRVQFGFQKGSSQTVLDIRLSNPLSGFVLCTNFNTVAGQTIGNFFVIFETIADGASLPPPFGTGFGYILEVRADNNSYASNVNQFLQITSFTRFSAHYGSLHH